MEDPHLPVDLTNKVILQIAVFYALAIITDCCYFFLEFRQFNPRRKMEVG